MKVLKKETYNISLNNTYSNDMELLVKISEAK